MSPPDSQRSLFSVPPPESGLVLVNDRVTVRTQGIFRVVTVDGLSIYHYPLTDRMAEACAMVMLVEAGHADQNDVARAFGCTDRTLRRLQERNTAGGLAALGRPRGRPMGSVSPGKFDRIRDREILRLKAEGESHREVGRALGISEKAVRKRLRRLGWKPDASQAVLFAEASPPSPKHPATTPEKEEASACREDPLDEPFPHGLGSDPLDRSPDRLLAALGLLDDAAPRFAHVPCASRAGVLLAIPFLVKSGVLAVARDVYKSIGPAFYGLRTTLVSLLLFALLRIKRPEALKEYAPPDLGRILGLDRAPEVKTMRRKLSVLASIGRAERFGRELAKRRVAERGRMMGFLYIDGHVRVYHGKRVIPKGYVTRMRLALPADTDYWVNDQRGDPLFVVTAEANASLLRMLPVLLKEIRGLVGKKRHVTVVFDRGGWSPKFFRKMIRDGFDVLTYRRGRVPAVPEKRFRLHKARLDGRRVEYRLDDRRVRLLGGRLRLRQVTRLSDDGQHQTPIVTSRTDLPAVVVAYRMFERWRQENFFKYLRDEFALDALADYRAEAADPRRSVPNPEWRKANRTLAAARVEIGELHREMGVAALENPEGKRPTMRGFKIAHGELGRKIREADERIARLRAQRGSLEKRVPVAETMKGQPVIRLAAEKKHLTNILKMLAYQIESDLVEHLGPHYARNDQEGRTLVQAALQSAAEIEPAGDEIRVTLAPLSSPHRSKAVAGLCETLNRENVCFPGTASRMRFAVAKDSPEEKKRTNSDLLT